MNCYGSNQEKNDQETLVEIINKILNDLYGGIPYNALGTQITPPSYFYFFFFPFL